MAITPSFVDHASITTGNSVATASQSPAANELWIVDVYMRGTGITPSVSGTGLTWTQVAQVDAAQSGPQLRLWRFRGLSTSTPSSGAITVTVTGNTKPVTVQVWKATGVNTSGTNGSGAIAQTVTNQGPAVDDANLTQTITTTYGNAVVVGFGGHRTKTYTLQSGETSIDLNYIAGTVGDVAAGSVFYKTATTAGSSVTLGASGSLSGAIDWAMITTELRAASAATDASVTLARTLAATIGQQAGAQGAAALARSVAMNTGQQAGAYGSAALARTLATAISQQANTQGSAALARTLATAISQQANTQGSASLPRSMAVTPGQNAGAYGSAALARTLALAVAGGLLVDTTLTLARVHDLIADGIKTISAIVDLGITRSLNVDQQADAQAAASLDRTMAATPDQQADAQGALAALDRAVDATVGQQADAQGATTLDRAVDATVGQQADAQAAASLDRTMAVTPDPQADAQGALAALERALDLAIDPNADAYAAPSSLDRTLALIATSYKLVAATVTLGRALSVDNLFGWREFGATVTLDIHPDLSVLGQKVFLTGVTIAKTVAIQPSGQAGAQGTVAVDITLALSTDGEQLIVVIVTPTDRTLIVPQESRSFDVIHAPDLDMGPEVRTFDV